MTDESHSPAESPKKYSAVALRAAIQTLDELLGRSTIDAILDDLVRQGIALDSYANYTIEQIQTALENIFGYETSMYFIDRVTKTLAKQLE